jgi:hypothetical protein
MACAKRSCLGLAQYSKGRHHEAQREAERTGQGVWKGSYVEPWLYRAYIRASGRCKCPSLSDPSKAPIHKLRWPVTILGQVALAPFGRLTLPIILNCHIAE